MKAHSFSVPDFVYFDLGNVLLHFDHEIACIQIARVVDRSPDKVRNVIFESTLQQLYEDGMISSEEFFDRFCQALELTADKKEVLLAASAIFEVNYPIIPLLTQLRLAGVKLGILSNTCEAHWNYISDGRYRFVNELFQSAALSFELKCSKPDPQIYQLASKIADCAPANIFFVDDRPENVLGAVAAGMDAVLYVSPVQLIRDLKQRGMLPAI